MIIGRRRFPSCEPVASPANPISTEVPIMLRARWAVAVLAGGLGLMSGCSTLRDHPWFSRSRPAPAAAPCCEAPAVPIGEGPVLEGGPPIVPPPNGQFPPGIQPPPP